MNRGKEGQESGKKYEIKVYRIVKKCTLNNQLFNTQEETELGCYNSNNIENDIVCNFQHEKDLAIEIKKESTPDWMQCSLHYDEKIGRWIGSKNSKIPEKCKKIYEEFLIGKELFGGNIPPFFKKKLTYDEWLFIKNSCNHYRDIYIDCPNTIIKQLYQEKGCKYIQISKKGLYHLGEDICHFDVPEFICDQQLRIRIKTHQKKDRKGKCQLSVIISCLPKNIKQLEKSKYSFDTIHRLPSNLVYQQPIK
jgi:hypothetical protein